MTTDGPEHHAPDPLNGGGMGAREAEVKWRISRDPAMRGTVKAGEVEAHPRNGQAVWIKVDGLRPAIIDPAATLLGAVQEEWLFERLQRSRATWNVLAQQIILMRWDLGVLTGQPVNFFNVDAWDGYQVARDRLTQFLGDAHIRNPVVLSGDIHSSWAADLRSKGADVNSPIVGAEFVGSGITSPFSKNYSIKS